MGRGIRGQFPTSDRIFDMRDACWIRVRCLEGLADRRLRYYSGQHRFIRCVEILLARICREDDEGG